MARAHSAIASPDGPCVSVNGLRKSFSGRTAVEGLSLALQPGEVVGLVGANGGGKTTSLRMLAGLLVPDVGTGTVLGRDLRRDASSLRHEIGYLAQGFSLHAELTIAENLRFRADLYGTSRPRIAVARALERFGLSALADQPVKQLSGGWSRRAQVAAAVVHEPRLVLLDEPTTGLDLAAQRQIWGHIMAMTEAGVGILVATHDLREAERCDRVAFLVDGAMRAYGSPRDLISQVAVQQVSTRANPTLEDVALGLLSQAEPAR